MKKKNGFTLIELIAVLVILAILALIVTPLVMNIIRKAKISADKRSIDAYGRSVELAIANYLLDNGDFPAEISQLSIEYSGDRVECSTTQLNSDSSVYLAGCTVGGRSVEGYTYGKEETVTYKSYEVGDQVSYNNVDYYVIKDTDSNVTLLKAEPLTVAEVNQYGAGHINRYTNDSVGTAYNNNGYGGMAYYTSETCGRVDHKLVKTGCKNDYESSEVKYVVDAWAADKFNTSSLAADSTGYSARLITQEDLITNLGYDETKNSTGGGFAVTENVPDWVYNNDYSYYTMSKYSDSNSILNVGNISIFPREITYWLNYKDVVRPVITIKKSALN